VSAATFERLVAAIASQDEAAIASCFSDDVQFRALVPPGVRERSGAAETARLISGWFEDSTELELVSRGTEDVGDRVHLWYRFAGVEDGQAYVVEHHLMCIAGEGTIDRADLLCSGFRPRGVDMIGG
jgi:hypothetical protein